MDLFCLEDLKIKFTRIMYNKVECTKQNKNKTLEDRTIYTCLFRRNGMQSTERNRTKGKLSFRSVQLDVAVGRSLQNCSNLSRPKADSQAERFKLLTIRSVPLEEAGINDP
uniref:Uncharacterized protein n=1 Tax=Romanomermis culicivorax TaxID=13658 RepID=A0A915HJG9_ROMCU